ncbi:uncharacterized protein B0T23DRAFT_307478, partial [Neurospora hispaniola]
ILNVQIKFYFNRSAINNTKIQFYYLFAYLSPAIKKPLIAFAITLQSPQKLFKKFKFTYKDPNIVKRANQELY